MTALTLRHRLIIKNFVTSWLRIKLSSLLVVNTSSFNVQLLKVKNKEFMSSLGKRVEKTSRNKKPYPSIRIFFFVSKNVKKQQIVVKKTSVKLP